jgi:iron complex outermembrane receptor protein
MQSLDEVPIALSVIRFDDRLGGSTSSDTQTIARSSEGLALTGLGPGRNRLFLRGVADSAFGGESQATVAVVLDEARLTYSAPDPDLRLIDVARVEVLKGPQGSLYGIGTLGGIYHIVTRRPMLDETSLVASAGVESVAHGGIGGSGSAVFNLPLGQSSAALRLVGYGAREAGWVDTGNNRDSKVSDLIGARIALAVEPGGGWRIDLAGVAQWLDTPDSQYVYSAQTRSRPAQIAEPHDNDLRHVALRAERSAGPVALVLSSGVTWHGIDDVLDATQGAGNFGLADPRLFSDRRRYRVWDSEVRAIGSAGSIRWLTGLSYVRAEQHGQQALQAASGAVVTLDDNRRIALDSAVFGDVTVPVFGSVDLNLGARVFHNVQHDARRLPGGMVRRETTRTGVTPSAAISWKPRAGRLVFVRYGSALRQGGVDISQTGAPVLLKGDEFATIEAGLREERPGGARIELGVWHSWCEDVQSDLLQPNGLIETDNAGNARIRGAEASVSAPLSGGWKGEAGLNITSAILTRNALGLRLDDRRLPVVPDFVLRGALSRAFAVGDGEARIKASLRYTGPARLSFDPVVDRRMGNVLESSLDAQFASGSWLWSAGIDNLLGASADTFAYGNPLRFGLTRQRTPQRPRTVSFGLQRRF